MFHVYILYSKEVDKYYVGQTENIKERLASHTAGISSYTSISNDWTIVYSESFETRNEAIRRENEIKKKKIHRMVNLKSKFIGLSSFGHECFRDASLAGKR